MSARRSVWEAVLHLLQTEVDALLKVSRSLAFLLESSSRTLPARALLLFPLLWGLIVIPLWVAITVWALSRFGHVPSANVLAWLTFATAAALVGLAFSYYIITLNYRILRRTITLYPPDTVGIATIFMAYAAADVQVARRLADDLMIDGYSVFMAEDVIAAGDRISEKVAESIRRADFLVTIFSPAAVRSEAVAREVQIAQQSGRKVFPVVIGDAVPPEPLRDIMYVDMSRSYSQAYRALERAIRQSAAMKEKTSGGTA